MERRKVLPLVPRESAVESWLSSLGYELSRSPDEADVIVFFPSAVEKAHALARDHSLPCLACRPVETKLDGWFVADDAMSFAAVRADAYASEPRALDQALRFVIDEARTERFQGSLRITWLGSLGEVHPVASPPIGSSVPLLENLTVGRSVSAQLCLRQGAHSDQNTVARLHAIFERTSEGAFVRDLGSTNGTWVRGSMVERADLRPGDEVGIACTHRLRLDGVPGPVE